MKELRIKTSCIIRRKRTKEAWRVLANGMNAEGEARVMNKGMTGERMTIEGEIRGKATSLPKTWRDVVIELHFRAREEERDIRKYLIFALTCAYSGIDEKSNLNLKRDCKIDWN